MAVDIEYLTEAYFTFDEPVPYQLSDSQKIFVKPVSVKDSALFLTSCDILNIDKNSIPSPQVISMSYLEFLITCVVGTEANLQKFVNLLNICLGFTRPRVLKGQTGKFVVKDDQTGLVITHKQFEDIRKIILYQNILHFDDSYINPDLKKAMDEMDALRNSNVIVPTLERKMAIITAHCGISKKEQMSMSLRSHSLLFEEVCGEVEFMTLRPIAMMSKESAKSFDHWIFKKKKNKIDEYIVDVDKYHQSMGGEGHVKMSASTAQGDKFEQMYNNVINQK